MTKKLYAQLPVHFPIQRSSRPELFCKKVFVEISQNSQENTSARVSFLIKLQAWTCNFNKRETLAQVFFCAFCEISKNTFLHRTPSVDGSVFTVNNQNYWNSFT